MAHQRLQGLKAKFIRDPSYRDRYTRFMDKLIGQGYVEAIPPECEPEGVWYIPHHGVFNNRKAGKICVVFECSAKYSGISLNNVLLQGPDSTNSLLGILCRFRQDHVAFSCDVQQMFHQFRVRESDRNLLRFLWWEGGDYNKPPTEFRMCLHLFGATSSPRCCAFGLNYIADQFCLIHGDAAAEFIHHNFYIDDGLKSMPSRSDAIDLIQGTRKLCREGGLHLHKFVSNENVLDDVPEEDRASGSVPHMIIGEGAFVVENFIGVQWCLENDTLGFRIMLQDKL